MLAGRSQSCPPECGTPGPTAHSLVRAWFLGRTISVLGHNCGLPFQALALVRHTELRCSPFSS